MFSVKKITYLLLLSLLMASHSNLIAMAKISGIDKVALELELETRTESQILSMAPGSKLNITNTNGQITIEGWDKNTIKIEAMIKDTATHRIKIESTQNEQGVTIDVRYPGRGKAFWGLVQWNWDLVKNERPQCDLTLFVPRKLQGSFRNTNGGIRLTNLEGFIEVKSVNGNLDARQITGTMEGKTVNGTITINETEADVNISTTNGLIKLDGVSGSINAKTINGSIQAKNLNGQDRGISFNTVNGAVRLTLGSATGSVHLSNVLGKISFTDQRGVVFQGRRLFTTDIPNSNQKIKVSTVNGPIDVIQ